MRRVAPMIQIHNCVRNTHAHMMNRLSVVTDHSLQSAGLRNACDRPVSPPLTSALAGPTFLESRCKNESRKHKPEEGSVAAIDPSRIAAFDYPDLQRACDPQTGLLTWLRTRATVIPVIKGSQYAAGFGLQMAIYKPPG